MGCVPRIVTLSRCHAVTNVGTMNAPNLKRSNRRLVTQLWLFALGAFGFGFALIPLYRVICDVTGYGDRTQLVRAAPIEAAPVTNRLVTVEMLSAMPTFGSWDFHPVARSMQVQPGRIYEAHFYAK